MAVREGMRVRIVNADPEEFRTIHLVPEGGWTAVNDKGAVCGRGTNNKLPYWYEEVSEVDEFEAKLALAGLNNELKHAQQQFAEGKVTIARLEKQLEQLKPYLPPFEKGQKVRTPTKGALVVDDVAQAFGGWVVLGHFPGSPTKKYTYPATELEAA